MLGSVFVLSSCGDHLRLKQQLAAVKAETLETVNECKPIQDHLYQTGVTVKSLQKSVAAAERDANNPGGKRMEAAKKKEYLESVLKYVEAQISVMKKEREEYAAKYFSK